MNLQKKFLMILMAASCCIFAGNGYAEEVEEGLPEQVAKIGERASEFKNKRITKDDFKNLEEVEEAEEAKQEEEGDEVKSKTVYLVDDVTYMAAHYVYGVSDGGGLVQINDGSIWNVASGDRYKTINWYTSDLVVLAENDNFFPTTRFKLLNLTLGNEAAVEISLGPRLDWDYRWVYAIDYYNMLVWLDDGTCWDVSGSVSQFDRWYVNDVMIVGVYRGWGSGTYPFILYNVSTDDYMIADYL